MIGGLRYKSTLFVLGIVLFLICFHYPVMGAPVDLQGKIVRSELNQTNMVDRLSLNSIQGWMFRADLKHSGFYNDGGIRPTNFLLWTFSTGAPVSSSPSVINDMVYVGSTNGNLYAINANSGREKWHFTTKGGGMISSPAVSNGMVFIGGGDNTLYAIDANTGQEKWNFSGTGSISSLISSPAVFNNVVYFGKINHKLYALDAGSGKELWNFAAQNQIISSPAVDKNIVYIGATDDKIYAIDASSGKEIWNNPIKLSISNHAGTAPVIASGLVYVVSDSGHLLSLYAENGTIKKAYFSTAEITTSPALTDNIVYFGSSNGKVYALNADTGQEKWSFTTGSSIYSSPSVAGGVVYVGSDDNKLYAVDTITGKEKWSYLTGSKIFSSPAIANGVVYIGSDDGKLYAIGKPSIKIDPISDQPVNTKFVISGTTNLPVGTDIIIAITSDSFKPTKNSQSGSFSGISEMIKIVKGDERMNRWSFQVDGSTFGIGGYIVTAMHGTSDSSTKGSFNIINSIAPITTTPKQNAIFPLLPSIPGFVGMIAIIAICFAFALVRKNE